MASRTAFLSSLPNELLHQIFEYLSIPAPSALKLKHAPSPTLTDSPDSSLKNISLMCKKLRRVVLEYLFAHTRFKCNPGHLHQDNLHGSYSCIIGSNEYKDGFEPIIEKWPKGYCKMMDFLIDAGLTKYVQSMTIVIEAQPVWPEAIESWTRLNDLCPDPSIFPAVDRLNVVAPYMILKGLLRIGSHKHHPWDLESPYGPYRAISFHVSLQPGQENQSSKRRLQSRPAISSNPLSWGDITLNEGYPFSQETGGDLFLTALINLARDDDHEQSPDMFRTLLPVLRRPTQNFTYIAMYPPQSHVNEVMQRILLHTKHLRLQLLPHADTLKEWNVEDPTGESMTKLNERYIKKFCERFFKKISYMDRYLDKFPLERITMLDGFVGRDKRVWRNILKHARRRGRIDICWHDEIAGHEAVALVKRQQAVLVGV
ncbi:hypothetical protein MMC10_003301 [Thelotrema lepadinum]|nr:hypothetical protein [Thelotrema lepadinum]